MRIEEELKLDYSDVLFRPKRSTLSSRKDVDLERTYKFKYSKNEWSGIPPDGEKLSLEPDLRLIDFDGFNSQYFKLVEIKV